MNLGDVNGDGLTNQIAGNIVQIISPSPTVLNDSNQGVVEGNRAQPIVETMVYNQFGLMTRSVDPEGRAWRVEASFVSDRGHAATSVSEVVWLWLEAPDSTWSLVERITPWSACEITPDLCHEFGGALLASLDLPTETR